MLDDLMSIIETGEFEDLGGLRILTANWTDDTLTLEIEANHGTGESSQWNFIFSGVLAQCITDTNDCGLNIWRDEHPALLQYTSRTQSLYISSTPSNPPEVVGRMWAVHQGLVDDWIPFDRHLNSEMPIENVLQSGNGLIATGPTFLLQVYFQVLEAFKCGPSLVASTNTTREALLAYIGESYIVSEELKVERRGP